LDESVSLDELVLKDQSEMQEQCCVERDVAGDVQAQQIVRYENERKTGQRHGDQ
jgi:hypothetical protein